MLIATPVRTVANAAQIAVRASSRWDGLYSGALSRCRTSATTARPSDSTASASATTDVIGRLGDLSTIYRSNPRSSTCTEWVSAPTAR